MTKSINIIIVDDEKIIRAGVASWLKNSEIKIIGEAESGEELFPLLRNKNKDVLLLDLEMPKLN